MRRTTKLREPSWSWKDEESVDFEKREDSPISQDWTPEVLQLDELPLPGPDNGEVRLRVKAIWLNRAEVHFRQGRYRFPPVLPSKIGYEASGIVEAVGPDVNRSWLGKTASTVPAFPANKYGVYGEVAIVPVTAIAEYPAHLSFEKGTSIWMQYLTSVLHTVHPSD